MRDKVLPKGLPYDNDGGSWSNASDNSIHHFHHSSVNIHHHKHHSDYSSFDYRYNLQELRSTEYFLQAFESEFCHPRNIPRANSSIVEPTQIYRYLGTHHRSPVNHVSNRPKISVANLTLINVADIFTSDSFIYEMQKRTSLSSLLPDID